MLPGRIAVSRDGLLACPLPDGVHVWNAPDGKAKYVLNADQGDVVKVEFVADGSSLLTVTRDGLVRRWDAASGKLLAMGTIPQNEPLFDPIFRFGDGGAISILHGSYIDAVTLNPPN
jgi:WD40 repeat protein